MLKLGIKIKSDNEKGEFYMSNKNFELGTAFLFDTLDAINKNDVQSLPNIKEFEQFSEAEEYFQTLKIKLDNYFYQYDLKLEDVNPTHLLFYSDIENLVAKTLDTVFYSTNEKISYLTERYSATNQSFIEMFDQEVDDYGGYSGIEIFVVKEKIDVILNKMICRYLREDPRELQKNDPLFLARYSKDEELLASLALSESKIIREALISNMNTPNAAYATIIIDDMIEVNNETNLILNTLSKEKLLDLAIFMIETLYAPDCPAHTEYFLGANEIINYVLDDFQKNESSLEFLIEVDNYKYLKQLDELKKALVENSPYQCLEQDECQLYVQTLHLVESHIENSICYLVEKKTYNNLKDTLNHIGTDKEEQLIQDPIMTIPYLKECYEDILFDGVADVFSSFPYGLAGQELHVISINEKLSFTFLDNRENREDFKLLQIGETDKLLSFANQASQESLFKDIENYTSEELEAILSCSNIHPYTLNFLGDSSSSLGIRLTIASHPNTSKETLERLECDEDKYVSLAAKDNLNVGKLSSLQIARMNYAQEYLKTEINYQVKNITEYDTINHEKISDIVANLFDKTVDVIRSGEINATLSYEIIEEMIRHEIYNSLENKEIDIMNFCDVTLDDISQTMDQQPKR